MMEWMALSAWNTHLQSRSLKNRCEVFGRLLYNFL